MKKTLLAILGVLCAATIALSVLSACGGGGDTGGGGGTGGTDGTGGTEQTYDVTAPDGEGYDVEVDKNTAKFGDKVTITVEVTDPDKYIESVNANSYELSENTDGTYTATITADTTITVKLADYEEVTSDGGVIWNSNNADSIVAGSNNGWYWDEDNNMVYAWTFDVIVNWDLVSMMNDRMTKLTSSNQSVIPDSAISYEINKASSGNSIAGFDVHIDTEKISVGSTWLTMTFKGGNGSSPEGTISVKISVTEEPAAPETMTVVFTYENDTDYPDKDILINVTDKSTNVTNTIWLSNFQDGEYSFEYAIGHTYMVSCSYSILGDDGYYDMTTLYLLEWQGTNIGAVNTLERDGEYARYTLELTTEGIEVPFTIQEN